MVVETLTETVELCKSKNDITTEPFAEAKKEELLKNTTSSINVRFTARDPPKRNEIRFEGGEIFRNSKNQNFNFN